MRGTARRKIVTRKGLPPFFSPASSYYSSLKCNRSAENLVKSISFMRRAELVGPRDLWPDIVEEILLPFTNSRVRSTNSIFETVRR